MSDYGQHSSPGGLPVFLGQPFQLIFKSLIAENLFDEPRHVAVTLTAPVNIGTADASKSLEVFRGLRRY